jgi:hypothetical protein
MAHETSDRTPGKLSIAQWLALVASIAFIGVGVAGFFVTGFDNFAGHDNMEHVLLFEVNPLHNIVHLVLGVAGLALFTRLRGALSYGVLVAVAYGGAFVYGLFALGREWDVLSLNAEDNWLHLGLAVLGGVIAAVAAYELSPSPRRATSGARRGSGTAAGHA